MWFYGTKMPAYDVLQEGNFFETHVIEYPIPSFKTQTTRKWTVIDYLRYVNPATSTLYEELFEKCSEQNSSVCAPNFLNNAKAGGFSVMFSGDVVDERNHLTGKRRKREEEEENGKILTILFQETKTIREH